MKFNLDCIPCFIRQALQAVRFATDDEAKHEAVVRRALQALLDIDWGGTPPGMARVVHRIVREEVGDNDPYALVKAESNRMALAMYSELADKVASSEDPVDTAVRLAIAGNIIDYGAKTSFDLEGTIERVLAADFAVSDLEGLRKDLSSAETVVYLADNAGEVVFDRLLMETIDRVYGRKRYIFFVKGGPIINDAMEEDAEAVGIKAMENVEIRKMGVGIPGTGPERESEAFRSQLSEGDVVISKGQGNYEGLSDMPGIYFLFMVKCPVVANDIREHSGLPIKTEDIVLWRSR